MRRIAVTGGIAEGKSTVLGYCREAGWETVSADEIAFQVFEQPEVQSGISEALGLARRATRDEVRESVASDHRFRRELNRLTHPRILTCLRANRAQIIEVPLLIEACLQDEFERIWVVTCGRDEQVARLTARVGPELAAKLIAAQLPSSAKTPFADRIIRTNLPKETVKRNVLAFVKNDLGDSRPA